MTVAPRSRLLWFAAVTVAPSCTLITASDTYGVIGWAVLAACVVTVFLDWALSMDRLSDVRVTLPDVTWHTQDRAGAIELVLAVEQPSAMERRIRVGLALPSEFVSRTEDFMAVIPADAAQARYAWHLTPKRRGKFAVERCHMEAVSSLGMWAIRRTVPVKAELRVNPNLLHERNDLAALFLKRGMLGIHAQRRFATGNGPNDRGLSRLHVLRAVEESLRRLQTDYIDLLYMHCWDPLTPLDESLCAFDDLVHSGKVRYIGVSNFKAWQLMKALAVSDAHGWARFIAAQYQYSLVVRDIEREFTDLLESERVGLTPWGPLGGGFLSGKYRRDQRPVDPLEGRLATQPDRDEEAWTRRAIDRNWAILEAVETVMAAHPGATHSQVAT